MSEITDIALNAVWHRGYEKGRMECWDELKGGKRWWLMYPFVMMIFLTLGFLFGTLFAVWLYHTGISVP